MESSNPDINGLNNKEELDEIPTVLDTSQIDHNSESSIKSNYPTPNNSSEELIINQDELHTKCIPIVPNISDLKEIKQGLPKESDGYSLIKSSVILASTPRKRLFFDSPKKETTSAYNLKKLCISPIIDFPQVQSASNIVTSQDVFNDQLLDENKEAYIPAHELMYIDRLLSYFQCNIDDSLSKCSSKTSPNSFRKASNHLLAFKRFVIDHGRHLAVCRKWPLVIDYVFMACRYVRSTPKWDNPTHNTARRQCFKSLLRFCMIALSHMKGTINKEKHEKYIKELKLLNDDDCNDGVLKCFQLLNFDRNAK